LEKHRCALLRLDQTLIWPNMAEHRAQKTRLARATRPNKRNPFALMTVKLGNPQPDMSVSYKFQI
jgi:hypothetical protein